MAGLGNWGKDGHPVLVLVLRRDVGADGEVWLQVMLVGYSSIFEKWNM